MREAVIVAAVRTAVGKAFKGSLKDTRTDDLAAIAIREAIRRVPNLEPKEIDDIILGCAFPEAEQGMNIARIAAFIAGIPYEVPSFTVNRFCASGLESIAIAAQRIQSGAAEVIIAGGAESMTLVPMTGNKYVPNLALMEKYPEAYFAMGTTAEVVAKKFSISREQQDRYSLGSHEKASKAIRDGKFEEEIAPVKTRLVVEQDGAKETREIVFKVDEGPRADTSLEKLAGLKPVFDPNGTVTAGNASQMSDGAAAVVVMSRERARSLGVKPLAVFRGYAVGGVPPEIMGIGPVVAIPKVLSHTGIKLEQVDLIELNEAFACQVLYVIDKTGLNPARVNVNGGAIALGHPLGCTGAKLTATLLHEMKRRAARFGMVTMCVGGGMGAAGIFEREG
ncbi:MAG: thiolase family protein [Deltaproteobacteria bacterium]|nr:thiolase family protein [Deltaproteobacteria bacterium]